MRASRGCAGSTPPQWLTDGLGKIENDLNAFTSDCKNQTGVGAAHKLVPIYRETLDLYARVKASDLNTEAKAGLELELGEKIDQFQTALKDLLGLDLVAFRASGGARGPADAAHLLMSPRAAFGRARSSASVHMSLTRWGARNSAGFGLRAVTARRGNPRLPPRSGDTQQPAAPASDTNFHVHAPADAPPTAPYFTRPTTEQPIYDISNEAWRERSFAPYPLSAWAEFTFDGVPIRLGETVQTLARVTGVGGVYQPLVVTPAIGVRVQPQARILPLDGSPLPVNVTVHAEHAADGIVDLKLPEGWRADPAQREFHLGTAGDTEPLVFSVSPAGDVAARAYAIKAVAHVGDQGYSAGWQSIGDPGLLPYNQYETAELRTRKIDVKVRRACVWATSWEQAIMFPRLSRRWASRPDLLNDDELATADLSQWNVLVVGIRAYSVRPALAAAEPRLEHFVERGGTVVVQYQGDTFPAPLPLSMGRFPERVVDEQDSVKLLDPSNSLLNLAQQDYFRRFRRMV